MTVLFPPPFHFIQALLSFCHRNGSLFDAKDTWIPAPHLIITTGGTGFSVLPNSKQQHSNSPQPHFHFAACAQQPRDVTPEAVGSLLEREAPGLLIATQASSFEVHACLAALCCVTVSFKMFFCSGLGAALIPIRIHLRHLSFIRCSRQATPMASLSRPVAGIRKNTVILTLPGNPKAVPEVGDLPFFVLL